MRTRLAAAADIGISPSRFDITVKDGGLPKPKRINASTVFDRKRLDEAFDALPREEGSNLQDGAPVHESGSKRGQKPRKIKALILGMVPRGGFEFSSICLKIRHFSNDDYPVYLLMYPAPRSSKRNYENMAFEG